MRYIHLLESYYSQEYKKNPLKYVARYNNIFLLRRLHEFQLVNYSCSVRSSQEREIIPFFISAHAPCKNISIFHFHNDVFLGIGKLLESNIVMRFVATFLIYHKK